MQDIELNIATGLSATSKKWKNTTVTWSALADRLSKPIVTAETYKQFISASKDDQSKIKDVGGFVGGFLTNGKRDKANVLNRQIVTLDIDFSHNNFWWDFTMLFDCAAVLHSTHKSCPDKPRHRLIIPLDREVSQEEYQAIARKIAGDLNIDLFDQSTFDVNRLMFWPSVSSDAEYYFQCQNGAILSADSILNTYINWHDTTEWPVASNIDSSILSGTDKQEDPCDKTGVVGMFCRAYTIQEAIETFLTDIYAPTIDGRYTYIAGSTAGGLVVYEDKFAYSHHGTDPAGGRLCNAFDLVRIHKFGYLDTTKTKRETDSKSYKAMENLVLHDTKTKKQLAEDRFSEAKMDFANELPDFKQEDNEWITDLEINSKGEYTNSATNIDIILKNDPLLKKAFVFNTLDNKRYVARNMPWRSLSCVPDTFRDVDYSGIRNYIERVYGISATQKIDDSLALEFEKNKFHPIIDYIKSLTWDGIKRIDTLLIDYFGAEDTVYTRAAIRKALCAAVARVFEPGIKFDIVLIIVGEQGTYKSTFIKKLGGPWFSDTFTTVQGKEAFEQIQGFWLIEIAELSGLKKAEVEAIKHYVSKCEDSFRPAYGRVIETYKRQCVFFGTTNNKDFLRDPTGNRRFAPIDTNHIKATKSVKDNLTQIEIDQIWAEAYELYKNNEPLYFSSTEESIAAIEQSKHSESDERKGIIEEYLTKLYPKNWPEMDLHDRRNWLESPLASKGEIKKEFVCIAEIWCECLGREKHDMSRYNTRDINDIMKQLKGWEAMTSTKSFPIYGTQKYYKRKE
ncbi:MAG: virulence-associated E family protein [Turicibacter sp.]|nr:virulence-associated E family protein [Turicibacter sp.]